MNWSTDCIKRSESTVKKYIIYYRQWLKKSRTRVELTAQDAEAKRFVAFNGGRIAATYTEREDPPRLKRPIRRPELRKAIEDAKRSEATLVICHLGRLVKNIAVTGSLANSDVDFACLDSPSITPETINMFSTTAEDLSRRISERSKAAMQACVARGVKLGSARPDHWKGREHLRGTKLAIAAAAKKKREKTKNTYAFLMPEIKAKRERGETLPEIAEWLNQQEKVTTAGKPFTQTAVWRLIKRYLGEEYLGSVRRKTQGSKVRVSDVPG
jgi:DNA invertase Pin-like site-specific DNA recombinase